MTDPCDNYLTCTEKQLVLFIKKEYPILQCDVCCHRFTKIKDVENHVETVYSDEYFFKGKTGYPNYLEEKDLLISSGKRYAHLVSRFTKPGRMLDVGSAAGFIMKGFQDSGWQTEGIEPNQTMASYGRDNLALDIFTGSLENFKTNHKYDLISLVQVIGHFYDLNKAIRNISQFLKDEGLVLVESWDMDSLYAKLMGSKWHEYSPPSVLHWFSDKTLTQLFNRYGFSLISKGYPNKRINAKHALSLLQEKSPHFVYKKLLFDQTIKLAGKHTLIYPFHDLKWYLYKKDADIKL
jgi:SAM-dependent methyltransferase